MCPGDHGPRATPSSAVESWRVAVASPALPQRSRRSAEANSRTPAQGRPPRQAPLQVPPLVLQGEVGAIRGGRDVVALDGPQPVEAPGDRQVHRAERERGPRRQERPQPVVVAVQPQDPGRARQVGGPAQQGQRLHAAQREGALQAELGPERAAAEPGHQLEPRDPHQRQVVVGPAALDRLGASQVVEAEAHRAQQVAAGPGGVEVAAVEAGQRGQRDDVGLDDTRPADGQLRGERRDVAVEERPPAGPGHAHLGGADQPGAGPEPGLGLAPRRARPAPASGGPGRDVGQPPALRGCRRRAVAPVVEGPGDLEQRAGGLGHHALSLAEPGGQLREGLAEREAAGAGGDHVVHRGELVVLRQLPRHGDGQRQAQRRPDAQPVATGHLVEEEPGHRVAHVVGGQAVGVEAPGPVGQAQLVEQGHGVRAVGRGRRDGVAHQADPEEDPLLRHGAPRGRARRRARGEGRRVEPELPRGRCRSARRSRRVVGPGRGRRHRQQQRPQQRRDPARGRVAVRRRHGAGGPAVVRGRRSGRR